MSLTGGIALFASVASAEVLIRTIVVNDLSVSAKHVLLPVAIAALAASLALLTAPLARRVRPRALRHQR